MSKFTLSKWLSSTGGPLVVMDESKAKLWTGIDGQPSDYDLACQTYDYAEKLSVHDTEVLVLGDEPLQTAIAVADDSVLIVRWKWAESEADIKREIDRFDFCSCSYDEILSVEWGGVNLVIFDAADIYNQEESLQFNAHSRGSEVRTLIFEPSSDMSLLIHVLKWV